jgi:anti-sigma regulatory factor (Ser/Thr protein kinase)
MEVIQHHVVPVTERSQASAARHLVQELAVQLGFSEHDRSRAALVATELATNLVKHTTEGGEVLLSARGADRELEVIAIDRGPGVRDVAAAMRDGHSTSGSLGLGLGGVRRLADSFDIHSTPHKGTVVLARLRPDARVATRQGGFVVAGISVACPGEPVCGDGWLTRMDGRALVCMVADGLGHGPGAADAARTAIRAFGEASTDDLPAALAQVHEALRPTRGAAASVLRLETGGSVARFAGVGNVAGVICHQESVRQAVTTNGTLGREVRPVREFSYPWYRDAMFVMHSDGLTSHWSLDSYPGVLLRDPALIAAVLYRDFWRGRDDVTVLVGREAA